MGAGTRGGAEGGCTRVGKVWAARVSVEGEEGGPGGEAGRGWSCCFFFEHGEDFSLELAFVELPAGRNRLCLLRESPGDRAVPCPALRGGSFGAAARAGGMGASSAAFLSPVSPSPFPSLSFCFFGGLC